MERSGRNIRLIWLWLSTISTWFSIVILFWAVMWGATLSRIFLISAGRWPREILLRMTAFLSRHVITESVQQHSAQHWMWQKALLNKYKRAGQTERFQRWNLFFRMSLKRETNCMVLCNSTNKEIKKWWNRRKSLLFYSWYWQNQEENVV